MERTTAGPAGERESPFTSKTTSARPGRLRALGGPIVSRTRANHMATWVDLDRLSPSVLRHLAAAKERASRPEYDDTDAMAEELALMVMEGRGRPSAGTADTVPERLPQRPPHRLPENLPTQHAGPFRPGSQPCQPPAWSHRQLALCTHVPRA